MYLAELNQSNQIIAVYNSSLANAPDGAVSISDAQFEQIRGRHVEFFLSNGELQAYPQAAADNLRDRTTSELLLRFDTEINKADLSAVLMQLTFVASATIEVTDYSALSTAQQTRLANIQSKLTKLVKAYRDKKKAQQDIQAGTDPSTITVPQVDSFDL